MLLEITIENIQTNNKEYRYQLPSLQLHYVESENSFPCEIYTSLVIFTMSWVGLS
jgi:hypothetical protein